MVKKRLALCVGLLMGASMMAQGPFCGAVDSEGCNAVRFNATNIKAWATGCELVLGPQVINVEGSPIVNFGTAADAIGAATTSVYDVVSLGDGGSATLTFDVVITNGEGPDIAVYENSFNDHFLEQAFVEVSSDGEHFVRFPATSLTQTETQINGMGSVDPTYINNLAGKFRVGYGTPFDLEELRDSANIDINHVTHVRIVDVVGSIDPTYGSYDAYGHLVNDPFPTDSYSGGFDLDGVAVLNCLSEGIEEAAANRISLYPNPASNSVAVCFEAGEGERQLAIYDIGGRLVEQHTVAAGSSQLLLNAATYRNGVYMVRMGEKTMKLVVRH